MAALKMIWRVDTGLDVPQSDIARACVGEIDAQEDVRGRIAYGRELLMEGIREVCGGTVLVPPENFLERLIKRLEGEDSDTWSRYKIVPMYYRANFVDPADAPASEFGAADDTGEERKNEISAVSAKSSTPNIAQKETPPPSDSDDGNKFSRYRKLAGI